MRGGVGGGVGGWSGAAARTLPRGPAVLGPCRCRGLGVPAARPTGAAAPRGPPWLPARLYHAVRRGLAVTEPGCRLSLHPFDVRAAQVPSAPEPAPAPGTARSERGGAPARPGT